MMRWIGIPRFDLGWSFFPLLLVIALGQPVRAQTVASSEPAVAHVTIPPGYEKGVFAGYSVISTAADRDWIGKAIAAIGPTSRPTTTPTDLLTSIDAHRAEITADISADTGPNDPRAINDLFDRRLIPLIRKFDQLRAPLIYMPITQVDLKRLIRGGWDDPRFHYNRITDEVLIDTALFLSVDEQMPDMLVPAIYQPTDNEQTRAAALLKAIRSTQSAMMREAAVQAQYRVQTTFIEFIAAHIFEPLKLKPDQKWFAIGISGILSAKYAAIINGVDRQALLTAMTYESKRTRVKAGPVDLIHPIPHESLRDEAIPLYVDAVRRKATIVLSNWIDKAGEGSLPRVLKALREQPPADGAGLIQLIRETTQIDLSADAAPR